MRTTRLLLLAVVPGCVAIAQSLDNAMPALSVTQVYEGEPRPRSEVARIRRSAYVMEGVGQPEVEGEANEIKVRIRSVDGVSCGENTGGGHYYEVLPGTCLLEVTWERFKGPKPLAPNIKPHYRKNFGSGTSWISAMVEAGKRYKLVVKATGYGPPGLELEEL